MISNQKKIFFHTEVCFLARKKQGEKQESGNDKGRHGRITSWGLAIRGKHRERHQTNTGDDEDLRNVLRAYETFYGPTKRVTRKGRVFS